MRRRRLSERRGSSNPTHIHTCSPPAPAQRSLPRQTMGEEWRWPALWYTGAFAQPSLCLQRAGVLTLACAARRARLLDPKLNCC